ncbi:MAG: UPF0280 family protein [Candidatus Omnitrophota bacterium]
MKSDKYQRRFYRDWVNVSDLYKTRLVDRETDLQILTDKVIDRAFLKRRVFLYRLAIENYIARDRRFLTSLEPLAVELNARMIVKEMARCARKAGVGPMAAVAGSIAEFLGRDLLRKGCKNVIIENGGDIFLKTTKPRLIGIYNGRRKLWNRLSLKIRPSDTPIGVCASSGTVGYSLSFGCADSVIVLSKNTCLADAVATAAGNLVRSRRDLMTALNFAKSIRGVIGVAIIIKGDLISWGKTEFVIN